MMAVDDENTNPSKPSYGSRIQRNPNMAELSLAQYCSDGLVPHIVESEPQVYRGKAHNIPRKQKEENCGMKGGKSRSEGEKLEMFDDVNLKTMIVVTDC